MLNTTPALCTTAWVFKIVFLREKHEAYCHALLFWRSHGREIFFEAMCVIHALLASNLSWHWIRHLYTSICLPLCCSWSCASTSCLRCNLGPRDVANTLFPLLHKHPGRSCSAISCKMKSQFLAMVQYPSFFRCCKDGAYRHRLDFSASRVIGNLSCIACR